MCYVTNGYIKECEGVVPCPGAAMTITMENIAVWLEGFDGACEMSLSEALDAILKRSVDGYKPPYSRNEIALGALAATLVRAGNGKTFVVEDASYDFYSNFNCINLNYLLVMQTHHIAETHHNIHVWI
jgi:hypothetical protein